MSNLTNFNQVHCETCEHKKVCKFRSVFEKLHKDVKDLISQAKRNESGEIFGGGAECNQYVSDNHIRNSAGLTSRSIINNKDII